MENIGRCANPNTPRCANPHESGGHSIITDPWGHVVVQLDEKEGVAIAELDLDEIDRTRENLPFLSARRTDLYRLEEV